MSRIAALIILVLFITDSVAQIKREILEFQFEGDMLNGVSNTPELIRPKGVVLLVHGSGLTNAVTQQWHYDVREAIIKSGYATFMWDKKGCGKSEGTEQVGFNISLCFSFKRSYYPAHSINISNHYLDLKTIWQERYLSLDLLA